MEFHPIEARTRDAKLVVPLLAKAYHPTSVVDFGCNRASYLAEFMNVGVTDLLGIDGDNMLEALEIPMSAFISHDLSGPLNLGRKYDLALCIEVAEHLAAECADTLVDTLCRHSDRIVFSAAQPGQGGYRHINEQKPEYWFEKFAAHGFRVDSAFDGLPTGVSWWLRRNLFVLQK